MKAKRITLTLVLVFICVLLTACATPEGTYKHAQELLTKGEYTAAAEKFASLESFQDAAAYAAFCKACALCEAGNYEGGIAALEALGDFTGCEERIAYYSSIAGPEYNYKKGQSLLAQGKYTEAAAKFESLGSYEDATTLTMYSKACALCENGDFETGINALTKLGDYKDCVHRISYYTARSWDDNSVGTTELEWMNRAKSIYNEDPLYLDSAERINALDTRIETAKQLIYDDAVTLGEQGQYDQAIVLFSRLGNYKESVQRAQYYGLRKKELSLMNLADEKVVDAVAAGYAGMGVYLDCAERAAAMTAKADAIREAKYTQAVAAVEHGRYDDAIATFQTLDNYKDSSNLLKTTYVTKGNAMMEARMWDVALAAYEAAGATDKAETAKMLKEVHYANEIKLPFSLTGKMPHYLIYETKIGKFGIMNLDGDLVLPPVYDNIDVHPENCSLFILRTGTGYANYKYGMFNADTGTLIEPEWKDCNGIYHDDGAALIAFEINNTWGIVDETGNIISNPQWRSVSQYADLNRIYVCKDGYWGCIDWNGNVVIPPEWDKIGRFNLTDYAVVHRDDREGLIDLNGNVVLPVKYQFISTIRVGSQTWVYIRGDYAHFDPVKHTVGTRYLDIQQMNDESGNVLVEVKNNHWAVANAFGTLISSPVEADNLDRFSEGFCAARIGRGSSYGYLNSNGQIVITAQWQEVEPFFGGVAAVQTGDNQWGLINQKGQYVVKAQWDNIKAWSVDYWAFGETNLYAVCENGKWGLIDLNGNMVVDLQWQECPIIYGEQDVAVIKQNWKEGVINFYGEIVIEPVWDDVIDYRGSLFAVKDQKKWGVLDKNGHTIIPIQYEEVEILGEDRFLVKSNGEWCILDAQGNYIW